MIQDGEEKISQEGNQGLAGAPATASSMGAMMPGSEGAAFGGIMGAMSVGSGLAKLVTDALNFHPLLDRQINYQMGKMIDVARNSATSNRKVGGVRPFMNSRISNRFNKPIVTVFQSSPIYFQLVKHKIAYYG
jgi:hypothetical protein